MANEEGSGRRMMYERPFDCSDAKKNSKYNYKLQTRDKLRSLFAATGLVDSPATEHFVTPSSRGVRNTLEHPSGSVNKPTSNNRGATKSFNDNGSLTVDLMNKLRVRLVGCKHLEEHEIDLIHALLNSYLSSDIKRKQNLTKDEERLFGQLAVVAFSKVPDGW